MLEKEKPQRIAGGSSLSANDALTHQRVSSFIWRRHNPFAPQGKAPPNGVTAWSRASDSYCCAPNQYGVFFVHSLEGYFRWRS